jgi:prepilin-type processing-associated H-X9-DG protein
MMMLGDAVGRITSGLLFDGGIFERWVPPGAVMGTPALLAKGNEIVYRQHDNAENVTFCDGHVQQSRISQVFFDTSDSELGKWNRDGKPHREAMFPY